MILFYSPEIIDNHILPKEEAQHCLKVLRMRTGDYIHLTDGKGNFYKAEIAEANPDNCQLRIIETLPQERHWKSRIEIALAPPKHPERTEWFAEKATELGIDKISFLNCRFSERKEIKTERIKRVMIAAMKQSLKAYLPELQEMTDFKKFISKNFEGQKFIAHCYPDKKPLLSHLYQAHNNVLALIGPEGDFSKEEVELAIEQGFIPVSLGESRLRTETAALTACQILHVVNQLYDNK
jgi:16S rRNA (uracil1498-N3)-methyltransferase